MSYIEKFSYLHFTHNSSHIYIFPFANVSYSLTKQLNVQLLDCNCLFTLSRLKDIQGGAWVVQ